MYAAIYIQGTDVTSDGTASGSGSAAFQKSVAGTLDLGVYASISPLASELIGIEPSGSLTLGMSLRFGPPQLFRGPRCVDLTLRPYAEIGVALAVDFFPDLSYSLPRLEGPPADIYRGPCWGYQGTVSVEYQASLLSESQALDDRRNYTVTMLDEPARYNGNSVSQSYLWQGSKVVHGVVQQGGPFSCTTDQTLTGQGSVTDPSGSDLWNEAPPDVVFKIPSGTISGTSTTVCSPDGGSTSETATDFLSGYLCGWVARPDPLAETSSLPAVRMTRTSTSGGSGSSTTCTLDVALQRVEFPATARRSG
jgi:hypothetical protein